MSREGVNGLLIIAVTAVIVFALARYAGQARPIRLDVHAGSIRPSRFIVGLGVVLSAALSGTALWAAAFAHGGLAAAILGVAFILGAVFLLPLLSPAAEVHWDDCGLEGPARLWLHSFIVGRDRIAWQDIAGAATTWSGWLFVQSHDGRRVYWSTMYSGHNALADAFRRHHPVDEVQAGGSE